MDWLSLLKEIFTVCVIPMLGVLTTYLVKAIKSKADEISINTENELYRKYVNMLSETISNCVIATNQTYVETLKNKNAFTKEAQTEAFNLTYEAVMGILSSDAMLYLTQIYGDVEEYVRHKIEAEVNFNKTQR